ncbi:MmgE/PrpD family protein [Micromonospora sp. NPDC005206]|uniref:MmgE/PrpD family protein n=1 Tax=Micromonospora sp. NPDC005206 TaxID=3157022 RepID=UPI0033A3A5C3
MTDDALTRAAAFVADGDLTDQAARQHARLLLVDAISLALAADTVPGATGLFELGAGSGEHRAWYGGRRLGAADAVQANAAAVCARFQDDTDMSSWAHPGSFVVPAAVAAAIEAGRSFGDLVDGLIAGYATTVWLGADGVVPLGMMSAGHRPSPTFGPIGAAAAAARALGLDAARTTHALSGAILVGRGSLHSVGAGGEDWRLHNPSAARDGFAYALAAAAGMTAGPGALDARFGFLRMFGQVSEVPEALWTPPGASLVLNVWMKALPTLGDNMAVALAARQLHERKVVPDGAVRVRMNEDFANFPGTQTRPPYATLTSALSSVRFVTAQLLLHGTLTFDDYARRDDPEIAALADRIEVTPDPELDYLDGVVTVEAADGTHSVRASELPRSLYFRDEAEQVRVATELHGERGRALVERLAGADDDEPARAAIDAALDLFED